MSWSWERWELRTRTIWEICFRRDGGWVSFFSFFLSFECNERVVWESSVVDRERTYRFIRFGCFAQSGGNAVDFFDHACEIFAHVVEAV
jgi:hypothetical protein